MQANSSELKRTPQGENSLAERIRWVLAFNGLQQHQLAEVMGVKTDRVKSLVLGRAARLRAEEIERLHAAYGLARPWLVDGSDPQPAGYAFQRGPDLPRVVFTPAEYRAAVEQQQAPLTSATDARLLQQVVDATAAALTARGLHLPPERRLRLYWAVFELSMVEGQVNTAAIGPLIKLAEGAG